MQINLNYGDFMSAESKKIQRKELIKIRNSIKNGDLIAKSLIIENKLFDMISYYGFETVFAFASFNNEVNIFGLMKRLLGNKIKIALPRVEGRTMNFYFVDDINTLIRNKMGILEPDAGIAKRIENDTDAHNSLMIVPLLGFDDDLNRIGYGGGYYDRYLREHRGRHRSIIGVAFEEQRCDKVETEDCDQKLDFVVTDLIPL